MTRAKKVGLWIGGTLAALGVAGGVAYVVADEPRPEGRQGPEADALAARIEGAVDLEAWEATGAVAWTFAGRHEHLWDRRRGVARVRWDDAEALLRVGGPSGRAYRDGREVHGADARAILERGHAAWINDAFWLNPIAKFRDDGVTLSVVPLEDETDALLVSYASGGLTPGDAYLWIPDDDGRPRAWRMWVSILPVGGVETSWSAWRRLGTGAWIATTHHGPLGFTLELTDVRGAATLDELVDGDDPFAPLFEETP